MTDFRRRRTINGDKFKLFGVMGCKPCAVKWKEARKAKNQKARIVKIHGGYEVWSTWEK